MEPLLSDDDTNIQGLFGLSTIPFDVQFLAKLLSSTTIPGGSSGGEDGETILDDEDDVFVLISKNHLDSLTKICYNYSIHKKFSRLEYLRIRQKIINEWQSNELINQLNLTKRDCDRIFSGLLQLNRCICRNLQKYSEKPDQLRQLILKQTLIPEKIFDLIYEKFFLDSSSSSSSLSKPNQLIKQSNLLPLINWDWIATGNRLITIKWQLRLAISDRFLTKIMEPYIRFELKYGTTSSTKMKTIVFECKMKQFHQLRFTIALLLKEFNKLKLNKFLQS